VESEEGLAEVYKRHILPSLAVLPIIPSNTAPQPSCKSSNALQCHAQTFRGWGGRERERERHTHTQRIKKQSHIRNYVYNRDICGRIK
jgi:hypothetical protein